MAAEDPYLYPGTQTLRNLREIRDPGELAVYETPVFMFPAIERRAVREA